jgi:tetratricopeptide (TPR) repeat protein
VYQNQNETEKALGYFKQSLALRREIGDKKGISNALISIGSIYLMQKKYPQAQEALENSLVLSRELGFPENISSTEEYLARVDSAMGNYKGAFEHYKQFIFFRDSLNSEASREAIIKSQLKYEFEKKEAVIKEQQEKERAVAREKARFQQIVIWSVILGLMLVIVFAAFVVRSLRTTRVQKLIIEEKQKEILDSIHYAKRIQQSILPPEGYIMNCLNRLNLK